MVDKEYNLRACVYKVQTFGTTQKVGFCLRRIEITICREEVVVETQRRIDALRFNT